jgi:hypothetical protein
MQHVPQIEGLLDRSLGPYTLHVQLVPRRRVGHFNIDIFLKEDEGKLSCDPIVTGIYSKGNPSSRIFGWLDIHYLDLFSFDKGDAGVLSNFPSRTRLPRTIKVDNPPSPPFSKGGMGGVETSCLSNMEGLSEELFGILGGCIPPGGMIFCSYITDMAWGIESPLHEVTRRCMGVNSLEIPPPTTPIGRLLVAAGCSNIKAGAYDVQGSSRLAGEKALDKEYKKSFTQRLIRQLEEYLGREPNPEYHDLEDICRSNGGVILDRMLM